MRANPPAEEAGGLCTIKNKCGLTKGQDACQSPHRRGGGNKLGVPDGTPFFCLAAAAVVVAAAVVTLGDAVAVAAAAEEQNQDDDPPAVAATKTVITTHNLYLQ